MRVIVRARGRIIYRYRMEVWNFDLYSLYVCSNVVLFLCEGILVIRYTIKVYRSGIIYHLSFILADHSKHPINTPPLQ